MNTKTKSRQILAFMIQIIILSFGLFEMSYDGVVNSYNSTIMALSYKYNFASRGLIGTIYRFMDSFTKTDLMNYPHVLLYTQAVTILFFVFLLLFCWYILKKCDVSRIKDASYMLYFLMILLVPAFACEHNFGRVDLYMIGLSILSVILLTMGTLEWLVIPLAAIAVMVHQGYVFMYFNIILVILIYKFFSSDRRGRIKYGAITVLAFVTVSVLFLWFEFFSRTDGSTFYSQVVSDATALSLNGEYHVTLLEHEILGTDLAAEEWDYHLKNFVEFPMYIILMLPFIIPALQIMINNIKEASGTEEKLKYLAVLLGVGTIAPNFVLKVDYGRWLIAVLVYYLSVHTFLLASKDKLITKSISRTFSTIGKNPMLSCFYIVYPLLFMPLWDVNIDMILARYSACINDVFHLWIDK